MGKYYQKAEDAAEPDHGEPTCIRVGQEGADDGHEVGRGQPEEEDVGCGGRLEAVLAGQVKDHVWH